MLNCAQTLERLALWVGDDLPADELAAVNEHLAECTTCRAQAEAWQRDHAQVVTAARADSGPKLDPVVMERAIAAGKTGVRQQTDRSAARFWRYVGPIAAILALVVIWRGIDHISPPGHAPVADPVRIVSWADLQVIFGGCLTEPIDPSDWQANDSGGVIAVLSPAPSGRGYVVADCIEAGDLARIQSFPWLEQRLNRYRRTDQGEREIVLAVCQTGDQTRTVRLQLKNSVLARFVSPG